jgi:nitrile hydratase accessory protein
MSTVSRDVTAMRGVEAPPRRNGELVFGAPWEGRAFALAVALQQRLGFPWDEFRRLLVAQIERDPQRPYYESWVAALEELISARISAAPPNEST